MKPVSMRSRARGFSLVEILVSLVIGLVVVGAVLVSMIGSGKAGRYQAAYAQMNEDAQIGLSILSRDLQMAGYSQPTGLVNTTPAATPTWQLSYGTLGASAHVMGCDTGFANVNAATVACGTATTPAFEVVYEADANNTVATTGVPSYPSDCLGNKITGNGDGVTVGPPYVAHNRYFISAGNSNRPELYCASPPNPPPNNIVVPKQPLIENIENMKVWYGVSVLANPTQVVRYVTATDIATQGAAEWAKVISVRVCLLVRSAEPVLNTGEDTLTYRDCDAASQTPTDRYLRRAYFTTAALRDKMP